VLGSRFLQDIAEFFILFQAMERGFVARAREVEALLGDPRTTFVVVTTLEAAPAHEAGYLVRELSERQYQVGAVVANRVMPPALTSRAAAKSATRLAAAASGNELAVEVAAALSGSKRGAGRVDADVVADVLSRVAESFHDVALVATREAERRAELAALAPHVVDVEALPTDVHDLQGLLAIVSSMRETAD
jgi:anion-transporting  ArsA/GET3 family ATPase